ncbi:hypothetical protein HU200_049744 [Digitaria exilis]|uniref:Cytochrome P450 n=1 Tax=Digitaria exilis TaxID=1010633 RepID=A0A835AYE8_9POAL|nr:hypothetical protein HU200_049744 [Digitaria exilis]
MISKQPPLVGYVFLDHGEAPAHLPPPRQCVRRPSCWSPHVLGLSPGSFAVASFLAASATELVLLLFPLTLSCGSAFPVGRPVYAVGRTLSPVQVWPGFGGIPEALFVPSPHTGSGDARVSPRGTEAFDPFVFLAAQGVGRDGVFRGSGEAEFSDQKRIEPSSTIMGVSYHPPAISGHHTTPLLPLIALLLTQLRFKKDKNGGRLPPGPLAVPLLGNWQRYFVAHLAARYGPVVSLRVGTRLVVLVADRRVAHAALVESGAALADRPVVTTREFLGETANGNTTVSRASYGPTWRLLRRNLVAETLNPSSPRMPGCSSRRLARGRAACSSAGSSELRHGVFYLLVLMCFGEPLSEEAARAAAAAQRNWIMFMAYQAYVFAASSVAASRWGWMLGGDRRSSSWHRSTRAGRERKKLTPKKKDTSSFEHAYVDTLLDIKLPNEEGGSRGLTDDELVSMCSEFLAAGTDTTSTALEWIMAELVKNPTIQGKLYSYIKETFSEEVTRRMPYLKAVVLEGLRSHPPTTTLSIRTQNLTLTRIPLYHYTIASHRTSTCAGLPAPRGASVHFTVAEMGRDETEWERPMEFSPERRRGGRDWLEGNQDDVWHEVPGDEVDMAERHEITTVMKKPASCLVHRRMIHRDGM